MSESDLPWLLGFSGGKDSSALLKLAYSAIAEQPVRKRKLLTIVYCDTGVEIPVMAQLVRDSLYALVKETEKDGVPISVKFAEPPVEDRFFVKVIGRGYPPPTNKFRWCTDRLRIKPVQQILKSVGGKECVMLLGIRQNESIERDRTIQQYGTADPYFFQQSHHAGVRIFSPIIHYNVEEVWSTIAHIRKPKGIDVKKLGALYKDASGECPTLKDPNGTPCGKGRFGCWTCTVVRKDRAMESMVREGHYDLIPLLEWRNWLQSIRDNRDYRLPMRRNGQVGPGPFTIETRREMLKRLLMVQSQTSWSLISEQEVHAIKQLWRKDM